MVMGKDDARVGSAIGIGFAALLHGYVVVRVLLALISMASWVREARNEMHSFFWATQQVEAAKEVEKEKVVKEEEPVLEQPTEPVVEQKIVVNRQSTTRSTQPNDIYQDNSKSTNTGNAGGEILDDTGKGIYDHESGSGSGVGPGSGNKALLARRRAPLRTSPAPKEDLSQPATLLGSKSWNCRPAEADAEGKDSATVTSWSPSASTAARRRSPSWPTQAPASAALPHLRLGRRYKPGLDRMAAPPRKRRPRSPSALLALTFWLRRWLRRRVSCWGRGSGRLATSWI